MPTAMAYGVTCRPPLVKKSSVLLFADVDAAAAAADEHARSRLAGAKTGVAPRFPRRDDTEQRRPRIPLRVRVPILVAVAFERPAIFDGDRRHPRRDLARIRRHVELGDGFRSTDAAPHVIPEALAAHAEGRDHADAGDHYAGRAVGGHALTIIWAVRAQAAALSPPALLFTWLGAIVFFVSLAYFLFSYLTTFGEPASGGAAAPAITWNVALFTVFALHHSVFARGRVRAAIARLLPQPLERSFYVWIASVLFIGVCALWQPVPGIAWRVDGPLVWVLRAVQAAGVWLTLRSAVVLDIRDLAGLRAAAGGAIEFKTSGPYGWVRHPIYTGWFLMVFAASPMTMTRLVFAAVSCAYLIIAIPLEERSMLNAAAGAYERYRKQVRWRLVPRIY